MTTPTDFREAVREDQRLRVLQALGRAPGYMANEPILLANLQTHGHAVPGDGLRAILAWLDDAGLLQLRGERGEIARLTPRGAEVANGTARHPGIARPGP